MTLYSSKSWENSHWSTSVVPCSINISPLMLILKLQARLRYVSKKNCTHVQMRKKGNTFSMLQLDECIIASFIWTYWQMICIDYDNPRWPDDFFSLRPSDSLLDAWDCWETGSNLFLYSNLSSSKRRLTCHSQQINRKNSIHNNCWLIVEHEKYNRTSWITALVFSWSVTLVSANLKYKGNH